jgi:hypothetical protein
VLTQLLHNLLGYTIQHTTYLSSCGVIGHASRPVSNIATDHQPLTLRSSLLVQPIRHEHYTFSYQLANWFCCEVSTTCYSSDAQVPSKLACKHPFFPQHPLHCYHHQSY